MPPDVRVPLEMDATSGIVGGMENEVDSTLKDEGLLRAGIERRIIGRKRYALIERCGLCLRQRYACR